jgi:hypothetical protein
MAAVLARQQQQQQQQVKFEEMHPVQIPTASAVLAAEVALLLAAPAAAMHTPAQKLLLRQPALDVTGLPLFSRIMNSSSSSRGSGGGSVRGVTAALLEKQWLLRLLWLGLRVRDGGCRRAAGCFAAQLSAVRRP